MESVSSGTMRLSSSKCLQFESGSLRSLSRNGSSCKGRDWAALEPELFALVLQRVQQRGREEKGEGRRVVALAGVCRHWRQLILQQACETSLSQTGLLQFPSALTQPGPWLQPLQCLLKRKGSVITLFQSSPADHHELEFLVAARSRFGLGGCIYDITANPKTFSKRAPGYIGMLKSNVWGSDFALFQCKLANPPDQHTLMRMKSAIAVVRFSQHFVDRGIRQRRISCIIPQPSAITPLYSDDAIPAGLQNFKRQLLTSTFRSWIGWTCTVGRVKQAINSFRRSSNVLMIDHQMRNSSFESIEGHDPGAARTLATKDQTAADPPSLQLRSKIPAWDDRQQCWALDFKGRATLPSMHNFQLIHAETSCDQASSSLDLTDQAAAAASGQEINIVLQVAKTGKGLYNMDFCYPLSAVQALAICLSSFSTSVGFEP
ncbi:hypothetical protein O6H91_20G050400 [Diphasiastrum complanatum]|uniref:Uncharacterized protein n=1 Tax=Diphasiastrum complanatum TaxID=34168 RepID=A0ACC2AR89_DIPCM|nr:hypothetical protein O6H91_20G050400 [Diphasiastrum complanatum]